MVEQLAPSRRRARSIPAPEPVEAKSKGLKKRSEESEAKLKLVNEEPLEDKTQDFRGYDIPPLEITTVTIGIASATSLIVHSFGAKSRKQMLENQMGSKVKKSRAGKDRDPVSEYEEAMYRFEDGRYGFPAQGICNAIVASAGSIRGLFKSQLSQCITVARNVEEGLFEIHSQKGPHMREDVVRLGGMARSADLRYRPEWDDWWIECHFDINTERLRIEQVIALMQRAGFGVGIGEWRPARGGSHGQFDILTNSQLESLKAAEAKGNSKRRSGASAKPVAKKRARKKVTRKTSR